MNHDLYTLKEFLVNNKLDQIIIPEIQRDYVWGIENVAGLLSAISEKCLNQKTKKYSEEIYNSFDTELKMLLKKTEEARSKTNIGFIYAYHDKELLDQYILIDGQQRFTTIFLILLCLAIKENKTEKFKENYFKNKLIIDYKVRDSSHEFLYKFVKYLLDGNKIVSIDDQYWYLDDYENDITIKTIIKNYKFIEEYLSSSDSITYDYIENNINFWYFDTDTSSQGEELYLYMNSRGEVVSQCENIKANLIKKQNTDEEKYTWGKKWEEWQDFFWKKRASNPNSDTGFQEFLIWITIIEHITCLKEKSIEQTSKEIRILHENNKINIDYLDFEIINVYFSALIKIDSMNLFNNKYLTSIRDLFSKKLGAIDYFRLLPVIIFIKANKTIDDLQIIRYARFFSNLSKIENIAKTPYNVLVNAVILTLLFVENKYDDVTSLTYLSVTGKFKTLLLDEEIEKLSIYQKHSDLREEAEKLFWEAEDNEFCNGSLKFIFRCIEPKINPESFSIESLDLFNKYFAIYKTFLSNRDDLFRRALLTKGDYKTCIGNSPSWGLGMERNSFIDSRSEWKEYLILENHPLLDSLKELISEYIKLNQPIDDETKNEFLKNIISDYVRNSKEEGWLYYFIKYPEILDFCANKVVCFNSFILTDDTKIILFPGKIASSYDISLNNFLKRIKDEGL